MNISKFNIAELYNNSKGKTTLTLVCAHTLIITGCIMALVGTFTQQNDAMLYGSGFTVQGAGLLGIRRFTADKEIKDENNTPG